MKTRDDDMTEDEDTMRPEYDFSKGVRGVTAQRYAKGSNVVVISPEVLEIFPDSAAVNEALRALIPILRRSQAAAENAPQLERAGKRSPTGGEAP